jgi:hypothetical protein
MTNCLGCDTITVVELGEAAWIREAPADEITNSTLEDVKIVQKVVAMLADGIRAHENTLTTAKERLSEQGDAERVRRAHGPRRC